MRTLTATIVNVCILALSPTLVLATNTGVEGSFGPDSGHYRYNRASYSESVSDAAVDSQGRILLAFLMDDASNPGTYWPAVMRLTPDGYGDATFGFLGLWVESSIAATPDCTLAIDVDASDRPVLGWTYEFDQVGIPNRDWYLRRLTSGGAVDTGHVVAFDIGIDTSGDRLDELTDLKVLADGRIVAVGGAQYDGTDWDFAVAVVKDNGSGGLTADTGFNTNGRRTVNFDLAGSSFYDIAAAVMANGEGDLTLVGWSHSSSGSVVSACRIDGSSGAVDSSFDGDGRATYAYAPLLDPALPARGVDVVSVTGGMVVGAVLTDGSYDRIGLLKVLSDGSADPTFGSLGWFTSNPTYPGLPFDSASTTLTGLVIDNDRLIYSASIVDPLDSNQGQGVVGITDLGGAPDTGFAAGGYDFYSFEPDGEATETGFSSVLLPSLSIIGNAVGRAVLVGGMRGVTSGASRSDDDLLATRIVTSGAIFSDGFESGGSTNWN